MRALDQRMKQMVVEEQGRRVVVPAGEQFTLETIHDHLMGLIFLRVEL